MIAPTSFFADYGCHVRILEEAQILQKLGHQVTIVTYRNGNDVPGLDIRRTLPIPWRQDYEVGSSRHKIAFDALLGWKTLTLLMREHFDVIHAHLHEGALIGEVLGRLFGVPVLFDFQGSLTEEMADHGFLPRESPLFRPALRLETWIDRTAPQIVTSSSHAERLLIERFGCDAARVHTLPDCVNGDAFRPAETYPAEELAALRAHLGIPTDRRLLVYLGLLAEHQGISHLLEAVRILVEKGRNLHLLLMGFPNVPVYQQKAQALGIGQRVTFTGRVPYGQAPIHLALGDAAVAPKLSNTEAAGKLLNYMAVGLPTVAFDTPVAREYLGLEGFLARRGDVASLAEQIEACLFPGEDVVAFRRRVGGRLRQRALQQFDWEQAGRQIVDLYERLLFTPQPTPAAARSWSPSRK
ncbi:MAG: glycosyltransferase family 1 protein [Caldilineae bacterium]|nr:MAG: glycosyltransferase family 1 protein [Caldilineae bacterium]